MNKKIYSDPDIGEIELNKSLRSSRISIKIHPVKGVRISLPYFCKYSDAIDFFLRKKSMILKSISEQDQRAAEANKNKLSEEKKKELIEIAKRTLPSKVEYLANKLGLSYNNVRIKDNKTNWGSCSSKRNINLNFRLILLDVVLCDFIILHELAHLTQANHSRNFHLLQEKYCQIHITELLSQENEYRKTLLHKIRKSSSEFPISYSLRQELKRRGREFF